MKKFFSLLIGCLLLGTVAVEAQTDNVRIINPINPEKEKKPRPEYGFEQSVDLSFNLGQSQASYGNEWSTNTLKTKATIMANWIGGYRFNNTLFIGGGAGMGCALATREEKSRYSSSEDDDNYMMINMFPHFRFYLGKKQVQPFVALSLGCSIVVLGNDWYSDGEAAFMINPEAGLNYRVKDHLSFYFCLGYMHTFTDGVQLKLGVTF